MRNNLGFAVAAFTCLAFVSPGFGQQTFSGIHGRLSVKGNRIVDKNGNPIALHGMSMFHWNSQGSMFYNASAINHLAQDWKCTAIRIPIMPSDYQNNAAAAVNEVRTVVDACIANGIYAIVDWHPGNNENPNMANAQRFFTAMATAYGTTPNIMYEPWNEPNMNYNDWATVVKPYDDSLVKTIRAVDPNNIVICGTPTWSQDVDVASRSPITNFSNVAYTLHFYAASYKQWLRDKLDTALKNGVAIFVTEYGSCENTGSGVFDSLETRRWWNHIDSNYIGCTNWAVETNTETAAVFNSSASATGPWTNANLTAPGIFVMNYIMSKYQGLSVGVLPDGSKLEQRTKAPTPNGSLTRDGAKASIFTINGVRCPAGSKLPSGLYIVRDAENPTVTGLMMR
jgi:endoglucanase